MKTDARVRYTVHMIQNVFLELLKEKPVAKITVKEICEHAEINRSTFYKHYQDVYDLMEKLENEAVEAFEKLLPCKAKTWDSLRNWPSSTAFYSRSSRIRHRTKKLTSCSKPKMSPN